MPIHKVTRISQLWGHPRVALAALISVISLAVSLMSVAGVMAAQQVFPRPVAAATVPGASVGPAAPRPGPGGTRPTGRILADPEDWPMFRQNAAGSGTPSPQSLLGRDATPKLVERWRNDLGGEVASSAAIVGRSVYVGSADQSLYALDADTGAVKWRFNAGGEINSSPAVLGGRVLFTSSDGTLHALDARTGRRLWSRTADYHQSPVTVAEPSSSGWVYVGSSRGTVEAFDLRGGQHWSFATRGNTVSIPAVRNGTLYVGSSDHSVYALNAQSGALKWSTMTKGSVSAAPTATTEKIYVGSRDGSFYALDSASGRILWAHRTAGPIHPSAALDAKRKVVYVGSGDGYFYALDAIKGRQLWKWNLRSPIVSSAAVTPGVVFVGAGNSIVGLDSRNGKQLWGQHLAGAVNASPGLSRGRLIVGSASHLIYSFGPPLAQPPADTSCLTAPAGTSGCPTPTWASPASPPRRS